MDNAILNILIKAKDEASATLKEVGGSMDEVKKKGGDLSKAFITAGGIMTGAGIAGALAVKDWVSASAEAEASMAQFEASMTSSFGAAPEMFRKVRTAALDTSKAFIQLGFDDEDTANAFVKLSSRTKDVGKAQEYMALAADMARMKHIDLGTAVDQIGKILMDKGNKVLTDYGIKAIKGGEATDYLAQIQKKAAGQAENYANTFAGSQERMAVTVQNLKEELGSALLPIFTKLATGALNLIDKFNKINPNILPIIGVVVAVASAFALLVGPLLVLVGMLGSGALAAGFATLGAVLLPAIGIIAGVVAVAIALYEAFIHWNDIVGFVQGIWSAVVGFFNNMAETISTWVSNTWSMITGFFTNIYNAVVAYLTFVFNFWSSIFTGIFNVVSYIFNQIYAVIEFVLGMIWAGIQIVFWTIYDFIASIWNSIWSVIGGTVTNIYNSIVAWLNSVWDVIQSIFNSVKNFITTIWNSIHSSVSGIMTNIHNVFSEKFNQVKNTVMSIFNSVYDWFSSKMDLFWDKVDGVTKKIKSAFEWMSQQVQNALHAIKFPHLNIGTGSTTIGGHKVEYPTIGIDWYKQGGWVKNTGLAVVHEGEYVLSRDMIAGRTPVSSQVTNDNSRDATVSLTAIINNPIDMDIVLDKLTFMLNHNYG